MNSDPEASSINGGDNGQEMGVNTATNKDPEAMAALAGPRFWQYEGRVRLPYTLGEAEKAPVGKIAWDVETARSSSLPPDPHNFYVTYAFCLAAALSGVVGSHYWPLAEDVYAVPLRDLKTPEEKEAWAALISKFKEWLGAANKTTLTPDSKGCCVFNDGNEWRIHPAAFPDKLLYGTLWLIRKDHGSALRDKVNVSSGERAKSDSPGIPPESVGYIFTTLPFPLPKVNFFSSGAPEAFPFTVPPVQLEGEVLAAGNLPGLGGGCDVLHQGEDIRAIRFGKPLQTLIVREPSIPVNHIGQRKED